MKFNDSEYEPYSGETVLECLLRNHVQVQYSCQSGLCQSCILRAHKGEISDVAQNGLKPSAIESSHFMACQQLASEIEACSEIEHEQLFTKAKLMEKNYLTEDICQLLIEPVNPLFYHAGQFINLRNPEGIVRSYSIANIPSDRPSIELHIRNKQNGKMTDWVFSRFTPGEMIDIQGPIGDCYYHLKSKEQPIVLIGTGTGAAPLLGIIRDAIKSAHLGEIKFYHGAKSEEGLYLHQLLLNMASEVNNFHYFPSISASQISDSKIIRSGYCNQLALSELRDNDNLTLFLAGNPEMVYKTRRDAFLAGIPSANIHADPFEYQELRQTKR